MADRPQGDILIASDVELYINARRFTKRITRVSTAESITAPSTTTIGDYVATARPTLYTNDLTFDIQEIGDPTQDLIEEFSNAEGDIVPVVFSQEGEVKVGGVTYVFQVVPRSKNTRIIAGGLIPTSFGIAQGGGQVLGKLRRTHASNGQQIWTGMSANPGPVTLSLTAVGVSLSDVASPAITLTNVTDYETALLVRTHSVTGNLTTAPTIQPFRVVSGGTDIAVGEAEVVSAETNYIWVIPSTEQIKIQFSKTTRGQAAAASVEVSLAWVEKL